jgi:endonuclease/exonuclease/phosphatase family metal-dependent hydrolase
VRSARRLAAFLLAAALGAACAARNYLDPEGPAYGGPASTASALPLPGSSLRVVTFNIEYGREIERALELLRSSEPLRSPDVLALQEMDSDGTSRIARGLGLNWVYFPGGVHPSSGRDFGCALLSPWRLEEPKKLILPHGSRVSGLKRAAVAATLVRGSERVRVYSIHLPSPLAISGKGRRDQIRTLLADAESSPHPVIMAGDFNSHGIGKELVEAGYAWPTREVGSTSRWLFLGFSFDHVFARGLRAASPGNAGTVRDNLGVSDHRPVWAVLAPSDWRVVLRSAP